MSDSTLLQSGSKYMHDPYSPVIAPGSGKTLYLYRNSVDLGDHSKQALCTSDSMRITTQTSTTAVFKQPAQVDYILPTQSELSEWTQFVIRLDITNNDAVNAALLLAGNFLIDYIEVLVGGSSIENKYNVMSLIEELYLEDSDESVLSNQVLGGFVGGVANVVYTAPAALAASGTKSIFLRFRPFMSVGKVFMDCVNQNITIRAHFNTTGLNTASLSTNISLTNSEMYIHGLKFDQGIRKQLQVRCATYDHVFGYYDQQRAILSSQVISATSKSTLKLTEFSGFDVACIFFWMVPAAAVQQNLYAPVALQKADLLVNGSTVGSFQDMSIQFVTLQMNKYFRGLTSPTTNSIYCISHAKNPRTSMNTGISEGTFRYSPNVLLELQAATGLAGTYDIYVIAAVKNQITIKTNGTVEKRVM